MINLVTRVRGGGECGLRDGDTLRGVECVEYAYIGLPPS
jgi:hypothetical protein